MIKCVGRASVLVLAMLAAPVLAKPGLAKPGLANPAVGNAQSVDLIVQARAAALANKPAEALDLYEAAILSNPVNPVPYVGLARTYETLGLQGKALRYYREALELSPNDVAVLESQALLMIAKGNTEKAQAGLTRIKKLCAKTACPAGVRVESALAKARTQTSMTGRIAPGRIMTTKPPVAKAVVTKPVVKPTVAPAPKK
jgi:tetratricopeptide (TPR) repeat protein